MAAEALLALLPQVPSASDIERVVRQFVELMTALSLPSSRAVAGLWAELWLMSVAADPQAAVTAWHEATADRFDFAFPDHLVEVKATEREERSHEFSYEQLRRSGLPVKIASLRLRRLQSGRSISDLVDTLQGSLSPEMRTKLVRNVFSAIGNAVSETADMRFDAAFAETNLRVIAADQLPVVVISEGSPISAVRFRLNLDDSSIRVIHLDGDARSLLEAPDMLCRSADNLILISALKVLNDGNTLPPQTARDVIQYVAEHCRSQLIELSYVESSDDDSKRREQRHLIRELMFRCNALGG